MIEGLNRDGLVLVTVLWVVAILSLIIAAVAYNSRLDTKVCMIGIDELRCNWACKAGFETAMAVLNDDLRDSDCLTDLWSYNEDDFNNVEFEECMFTVRVVDEASKLNINNATKEQFLLLPDMTEDVADSIIDWRDGDNDQSPKGAEASYYENLEYDYKIRNGPFRTIRELLLVKGVNPEIFYGEDTNFNEMLDDNEKDGNSTPPNDNGDKILDRGWIDYLTCYSYDRNLDAEGKKRVNINQASEDDLKNSLSIKKSYAKWIVENRNNKKYQSIADLIDNSSPKQPSDGDSDSNEAQKIDLETFSKIADKMAINEEKTLPGRININTAPIEVLTALLGEGDDNKKAAAGIIKYREGLNSGMRSIAEVMKAESVNINLFKSIAEKITTRSDVYTIRCFARAARSEGSVNRQLEAVADRKSSPCKILYWYQGAKN